MQTMIPGNLPAGDQRSPQSRTDSQARRGAAPAQTAAPQTKQPAVTISFSDRANEAFQRASAATVAAATLARQVAAGTLNRPGRDGGSLQSRDEPKNEAVGMLQQAQKSATADRKGAARQRLDAARARLQMLRMTGGDPKSIARQAKLIAQEIQAAAKEYSAALKAEGGGSLDAAPPAATAASPTPPIATADGNAEADAGAAAGASAAAGAQASATAPQRPGGDAEKMADDHSTAARDAKTSGEEKRQSIVDTAFQAVQRILGKSNEAAAEKEVLNAFKQGAREARQLIEEAIRRIKTDGPEANDAARSIKLVDEAVEELEKSMADGQASEAPLPVSTAALRVDITI